MVQVIATISSFYVITIDCKKHVCNVKAFFFKIFYFTDEVVCCELGQNQNNINNGVPNQKLLLQQILKINTTCHSLGIL